MGCRKDRYCSDMTRTFFCGTPDPKYAAIHDLVREANELAESMIRPGVPLRDLDKAARDHIAAAGYRGNSLPTGWDISSARRSMNKVTSAAPRI